MTALWIGISLIGLARASAEETTVKFAECPALVRTTFEREAKESKIEVVTKDVSDDGVTVFGAGVVVAGRHYYLSVDHDGGLIDMELETRDEEVKFASLPAQVRETFHREAKEAKFNEVIKDLKYGVVIYESVGKVGGRDYSIIVAESGILVEKTIVMEEEEVELSSCPAAVQHAIKEHARGGEIGVVTRLGGIAGPVFETDVAIDGKQYSVVVTGAGALISKAVIDDGE